jgi:hypothetical protein
LKRPTATTCDPLYRLTPAVLYGTARRASCPRRVLAKSEASGAYYLSRNGDFHSATLSFSVAHWVHPLLAALIILTDVMLQGAQSHRLAKFVKNWGRLENLRALGLHSFCFELPHYCSSIRVLEVTSS